MGLHDACGGVGVGAEEEMAELMDDNETEHLAFGKAEAIAAGDEILVVDLGINTAASVIEIGLAKRLGACGITARHNADREMARPINHSASRK